MTEDNADETAENSKLSRRTALALMGTSAVGGAAATSAFSQLTADRPINLGVDNSTADVSVAADDTNDELEITARNTFDAEVTPGDDRATYKTNNGAGTVSQNPLTVSLTDGDTAQLQFSHLSTDATSVGFDVGAFSNTSGLNISTSQSLTLSLDSAAIHRWTLDDADTSDSNGDGTLDSASDVWGSNTGSFSGTINTGQTSPSGQAYEFNTGEIATGTPDFTTDGSGNVTGFTVSVWVNPADSIIGDDRYRTPVGNDDGSNGFALTKDRGDIWQLSVRRADNSVASAEGSAATGGSWNHLAGVFDPSNSEAVLYNNGSQDGTTSISDRNLASSSVDIGNNASFDQPFTGQISDVRIYDRPLSESEVNAVYQDQY